MSSSSGIGNLSHTDPASYAQEEEPVDQIQESQHGETVPTVNEGELREQTLQGLGSAFPEAGGKGKEPGIIPGFHEIPAEIAAKIIQNADPETRKAMRGVNRWLRGAVNASVRKITLTKPEDADGGSAISQAHSAFKSAKDISLDGNQFTSHHVNKLASFASVKTVSLNDIEGKAVAGLPRDLQGLRLGSSKVKDMDLAGLPPALKTFVTSGTGITDAGLERLPKGVTSIALFPGSNPTGITDAGMEKLPPNLKRALVASNGVTDAGVKALSKQKDLQQLDIVSVGVTGNVIKDIPDSVHTLALPLSFTDMGAGLTNLPKNVHTLTVSGLESSISNQTIASLPKKVKKLHLVGHPLRPGEGVSPDRLEQLRRDNPDREITAEPFNNYVTRLALAAQGDGDQPFV
jgi:hypothetical protein